MSAKKASVKKNKPSKTKITPKKMPAIKEPLTKGGIVKTIMDVTALAKKDVVAVLEAFNSVIEGHIKTRGPEKFVYPGYFKITVVKKPARPARKGINPFTGEETMFKAKPAHKVVKVKALKKLKEMTA